MKKISNIISAIRNLQNWQEYVFHKTAVQKRDLQFVTKPIQLSFAVTKGESYSVFKEIFIQDFYNIGHILQYIPEQPVVVDIGANAGFFELLILSKRPLAVIYAFEPFPRNVDSLRKLLNQNPSFEKNINIVQKAVTGNPGKQIDFYVNDSVGVTAVGSIYNTFDRKNVSTIKVPTTSLNEIVTDFSLRSIDVLKLDCEGAEYEILYNTPATILSLIRLMLIEVHQLDNIDKNITSIEKFLLANNFNVVSKKFGNGCFYTYAINKNAKR